VIVLEGDRAAVVEEAVGLDHEAAVAPEEVHLPAAQFDVGLGEREVVVVNEREEVFLEVAALPLALHAFEVDSFELGLAPCATEEVKRDGAVEVVDRALDGGDRDAVAAGGDPLSSPSSNC
jgi:hypothetical protein